MRVLDDNCLKVYSKPLSMHASLDAGVHEEIIPCSAPQDFHMLTSGRFARALDEVAPSNVELHIVSSGSFQRSPLNARSIVDVMSLGIANGERFHVIVRADSKEAVSNSSSACKKALFQLCMLQE